MSPRGAHATAKPRRGMRRALVVFLSLLALVILVAAGGYGYVRYRYGEVHKLKVGNLAAEVPNHPVNILLVGDNCRNCLNGKQSQAFGTAAEVGGGRSDVTMILHLDPSNSTASLLSIPRDLFLPIPGSSDANRIDASLNNGPGSLVKTVEDDLGIPINHYVELNFDTFQSIVNALGGLDMYFPVPVRDYYSGLNVASSGCVHLNGFQALAVVRARHMYYEQNGVWKYDPFGDLSRIQRDHEFLKVLASAVEHRSLSNPLTANAVLESVVKYLNVDSGFSLSEMLGLVLHFKSIHVSQVPTETLPVIVDPYSYYYRGANYGDVVFPSEPQDRQAIQKMIDPPGAAALPGSQVAVEVLNGSGAAGEAGQVAGELGALGFDVTGTGDATVVGNPAETVVYYAPGQMGAAEEIASNLSGNVAMGEQSLPAGVDVEVVAGTGLSVNTPSSPGAASSSAPPSSSSSGAPPTAAVSALPSFDPTACPAQVAASAKNARG